MSELIAYSNFGVGETARTIERPSMPWQVDSSGTTSSKSSFMNVEFHSRQLNDWIGLHFGKYGLGRADELMQSKSVNQQYCSTFLTKNLT